MKTKLIIKDSSGIELQNVIFENQQIMDEFVNLLYNQQPWGQPQRIIHHEEIPATEEIPEVPAVPAYEEIIPGFIIEYVDMSSEDLRKEKLAEIAALEAQITPRRIREAVLSGNNSFIASIDEQIDALREQL